MSAVRRLGSFVWRSYPVRLVDLYYSSSVQSYAAGLAFNAFVTMFPLVLGLLAVLGFLVRDRAVEIDIQHALLSAFPSEAQREVAGSLREVRLHAGTLGLVSVLGLVWAGTGLFASMEFALNHIEGLPARSFLGRRWMGLQGILVFAVAVVMAVLVNWAIAAVGLAFLGFVLGWLLMSVMLLWIYLVVPNRQARLGEVWPGALVAGFLVEVLALVFPLFSAVTHRANTYGRGLALIFVLLSWLYLLAQLLLIGAVYNRFRSARRLAGVPELEETAALLLPKDADRRGIEVQAPRLEDVKP